MTQCFHHLILIGVIPNGVRIVPSDWIQEIGIVKNVRRNVVIVGEFRHLSQKNVARCRRFRDWHEWNDEFLLPRNFKRRVSRTVITLWSSKSSSFFKPWCTNDLIILLGARAGADDDRIIAVVEASYSCERGLGPERPACCEVSRVNRSSILD